MTTEEKSFLSAFRTEANLNAIDWVRWIHHTQGRTHCPTCLKLHECWFHKERAPKAPQHFLCHCEPEPMMYGEVVDNADATAPYSKFNPYLFNPQKTYTHNKEMLFENWGYSVADAEWLQAEIERQGLTKYISGEYSLGTLNQYGQRINIRVVIPNKLRGNSVSFVTGWMVHPNGQITLNTPFGGK